MATEQTGEAPAAADNSSFDLTLQEFCTRLSQTDKRVELIGGFEHSERVAGRLKDSEARFANRLAAFANQPA
jgi:hypothetical protein